MTATLAQTTGKVAGLSLTLNGTTAGNLIVVSVISSGSTAHTCSDGTNTYTKIETNAASNNRTSIFYAYNIAGGNITITLTAGSNPKAEAIEFGNVVSASDPVDTHTSANGLSTSAGPGSITTTGADGDVVVASFALTGTGSSITDPPTGFTSSWVDTGGTSPNGASDYVLASATGTYNPTWACTNQRWSACIASFKAKASTPSKTQTFDAALALRTLATETFDAALGLRTTTTQTFDATLGLRTTTTQTADAALALRTLKTETFDAALGLRTLVTQTFDAAPQSWSSKTQTLDAALGLRTLLTHTADAALGLRTTTTQTADAALGLRTLKTETFDAALALRTTASHTFDAVLATGLTDYISAQILIDWAGNGISVPVESIDDVSAYVVGSINIRRGRAKITDEIAAGTATFTLRNTDGRFTLLNTSSPLYPYNGYPARYCEINVTYRGTSYPLISGTVSQDSQDTFAKTVTFSLVDHFERFRLKLSSLSIQTGKRVDELLTAILDDPDVADTYPRTFDTGPETIGYFTDHNRRLDNALILAAKQDPGGLFFVDRSGNHIYHNRHHAALATTYATFSGNFDSLDPQVKQEDLADTVRATYPAMATDGSSTAVYTQNTAIACLPGTTTFDFEVNASGVVGASGYVTPLLATTDYVANSDSGGAGTDKTAQVTITITSSDSNGGTLSVVNADSSTIYLTTLKVRAYALRQSDIVNAVKVTTTSPVVTGQDIRHEFEFLDSSSVVSAWVHRESAVRSGMHVRPILKFSPDTDALMATALGGEIDAKIQVTDASAAWLTYVDGKFTIQGIELNINAPNTNRPPVEATWKLFDAQMSGINQFMISPDVGTARSSIAPDSNYSAYDWVAV